MSATHLPKNTFQVVIAYLDWLLGGQSPKSCIPKTDDPRNVHTDQKNPSESPESQKPRAVSTNIETRIGETTEIGAALEIGIRDLVDHIAPGGMQIYVDCIEIVGEAWVRVWFIEDMPPVMGRA